MADTLLWVRSPNNRQQSPKSFCGSLRGGFFQKAPSCASPLAFSFCFFFFCATLLKRKRRGRESDDRMGRVTLCQGGRIWNPPLRNKSIHIVGATIGRPLFRHKSNTVGGHSICPRCMEVHSNNRREPPSYGGQSVNSEQAGGETPPLQI